MSRIKLEFEKGGTFFAELLDQEAPRTCATFLAQLPAEIRFRHSMICGQAIASVKLPAGFNVDKEHQRNAGILPGTLSLLVKDDVLNIGFQMYIAYGMFSSRLTKIDDKIPVNVFGHIDDGLDQLREIGGRILMSGAETVRVSRS